MDAFDLKILALLQKDGRASIAAIANTVGLSATPCWVRVQRLEADGVIQRRVALLDPTRLGLGLTAFIFIEAADQADAQLDTLVSELVAMPNVLDFYRLSAEFHFVLRVLVEDMTAFDQLYKQLISMAVLKRVVSNIVIEEIKYSTMLPIPYSDLKLRQT